MSNHISYTVQKDALRTQILSLRKYLYKQDSTLINLRLLEWIQSFEKLPILAYYPIRGEVDLLLTYRTLLELGYSLYFPVTYPDRYMEFFLCRRLTDVQKISTLYEPMHREIHYLPESKSLGIIPSLALGETGSRLGWGKGFYDRYLSSHPNITTISPQFSSFIFKTIPHDPWDISMNFIVSERGIWNTKG